MGLLKCVEKLELCVSAAWWLSVPINGGPVKAYLRAEFNALKVVIRSACYFLKWIVNCTC